MQQLLSILSTKRQRRTSSKSTIENGRLKPKLPNQKLFSSPDVEALDIYPKTTSPAEVWIFRGLQMLTISTRCWTPSLNLAVTWPIACRNVTNSLKAVSARSRLESQPKDPSVQNRFSTSGYVWNKIQVKQNRLLKTMLDQSPFHPTEKVCWSGENRQLVPETYSYISTELRLIS